MKAVETDLVERWEKEEEEKERKRVARSKGPKDGASDEADAPYIGAYSGPKRFSNGRKVQEIEDIVTIFNRQIQSLQKEMYR